MAKILIVEDEKDMVQVMMERLDSYGHDVDVAFDALQAMMKLSKYKPDLVLLDISMPAGGGLQVLRNIRMNIRLFALPVIIMTGSQDEKIKEEAKKLGVAAYYIKPLDINVLKEKIAEIVKEKDAPEEA